MGRAFVFVHGGGQGGWVWDETIAALRLQAGDDVPTLTLDVPGCGAKRDRATDAIAMPDIADELAADLAASGFDDVTLVGHSQGGTALPMIASRRPDLIGRLVYVSCLVPLPDETAMNWRGSLPPFASPLDNHPPGSRERYAEMFCNDMDTAAANRFLDKLGVDTWPKASYTASGWRYDHLASIPSTYILCLRDAILPPKWQEVFADRLGADVVRIDAGHQAMTTRPQALAEVLLAI